MKRYIEAEALIKRIVDDTPVCSSDGANAEDHDIFIVGEAFAHVIGLIAAAPAADVQEVKRGKWIVREKDGSMYCPECHYAGVRASIDNGRVMLIARNKYKYNYCPNCGLKMEE